MCILGIALLSRFQVSHRDQVEAIVEIAFGQHE